MWSHRGLAAGVAAFLLLTSGLACSDDDSDGGSAGDVSATAHAGTAEGTWEEVAPLGSGAFADEWEPGKFPLALPPIVAFGGDLWMVAQKAAFSSSDGLTWTRYEKTDWGERIRQAYVFFDDRLWMFGGMEYTTQTFLNDIWYTEDGSTWEKGGDAAWPARSGQTVIEYQGKLWLFGGANHVSEDLSTDVFLNDVWTSKDGLAWTQIEATTPWLPRDDPKVVELNGALYLLGGNGQADVWRTEDVENWTLLEPEADWQPRHDYAGEVLDGRMWVFGGWAGESTNALNDVWYSTDGKAWRRQAEHAPWAPRMPRTAAFKDRLWIFSGKHTGADDSWGGDIWTLSVTP